MNYGPNKNRDLTDRPFVTPVPQGPDLPPVVDPYPTAALGPVKQSRAKIWISLALLIIACAVATLLVVLLSHTKHPATSKKQMSSSSSNQRLQLDPHKNYGNKYASGLLPVGDGRYVTATPKQGYVYACSQYAQSLASASGGAESRGPWFTANNTKYDINKKAHVSGNVTWHSNLDLSVNGDQRLITGNGLPNHPTGVFPVAPTDAAYTYDRNPNSIKTQVLSYTLALNPTYGSPQCMGGEAGVMLTGVPIFSAFDAGGRDAGAWEVQDGCSGHPQSSGEYHYHTLSSCITNTSASTVVGFALDGYPITGPYISKNNVLTTSDLDVCHGITSTITLDGKRATTYHYVMTQDFPYSVSCFRSKPVQIMPSANPQTNKNLPPPPK